MKRAGITTVLAALTLFLVAAAVASAHWNRQEGGPNGDVLDGHAHTDRQFGRGGCDVLLARDGMDESFGGDQGCDDVRGMEGSVDAAIVCDDNAGNDFAAGGAGGGDYCYAGNFDNIDIPSCEIIVPAGDNCV